MFAGWGATRRPGDSRGFSAEREQRAGARRSTGTDANAPAPTQIAAGNPTKPNETHMFTSKKLFSLA
ncbi:MAG TPA: hypothetical protein VFZ65_02590, partial [Planctomycetota bacterium]|nr:hypothetical protein [Planctomycetota bacterium]